ncbi:MAG: gluconeogenesis factor YvcK family protein [Patescibacteria group bacterium]
MFKRNESIVLVGGGGGVYRVARFLKHLRPNITTIQTVFDHGGHSGILRDEQGVLPPGDIRQAILALSDDNMEPSLRELMGYRFGENGKSSLDKATVGNILLTALTEIEGSLPLAINTLSKLCGVQGKVLPVSLDDAELCVELSDGSLLKGEGNIDTRSIDDDRTILGAYLEPKARIFVDAYEAIVNADKIVFCPGDIYTSLIPNLLTEGFKEALAESGAKLIYCVNLMTKKAETDGYSVLDFVETVCKYAGKSLDYAIYNSGSIDQEVIAEYEEEKCYPVRFTSSDQTLAKKWVGANLVDRVDDGNGLMIRHHERIASVIADF